MGSRLASLVYRSASVVRREASPQLGPSRQGVFPLGRQARGLAVSHAQPAPNLRKLHQSPTPQQVRHGPSLVGHDARPSKEAVVIASESLQAAPEEPVTRHPCRPALRLRHLAAFTSARDAAKNGRTKRVRTQIDLPLDRFPGIVATSSAFGHEPPEHLARTSAGATKLLQRPLCLEPRRSRRLKACV